MGITKENDKEDKDAEDNMDHRENQKFADHMKVDQVTQQSLNAWISNIWSKCMIFRLLNSVAIRIPDILQQETLKNLDKFVSGIQMVKVQIV